MEKEIDNVSLSGVDIRADSWAAKFTEAQHWALYHRATQPGGCWEDAAQWAVTEYHLDKMPSRSAFYRWFGIMRQLDYEQKLQDAIVTRAQSVELGKVAATEEELIAVHKSLAVNALMLEGNVKKANALIKTALAIQRIKLLRERLKIQEEKLAIEQAKLKIAQGKFKIYKRKMNPPRRKKLTDEEYNAKMNEIFGLPADYQPPCHEATEQSDGNTPPTQTVEEQPILTPEERSARTQAFFKEYKRRRRIRSRHRPSSNCPGTRSEHERQ